MAKLGFSIDSFGALRRARAGNEPDPAHAAVVAHLAGCHTIAARIWKDRRHIQDRDLFMIKQLVPGKLNIALAPDLEMIGLAIDVHPAMVTLVPESPEIRGIESGLQVRGKEKELRKPIAMLREADIDISLLIDPDPQQVKAALRLGITHIQVYTGHYARAAGPSIAEEYEKIVSLGRLQAHTGLVVSAGSGLSYSQASDIAATGSIHEIIVGHAIVSRACLSGLDRAVRDMLAAVG